MFEERYYQTEANEAVVTEYDKGVRKMMNVMATGSGKTICFAKLYEKMKSRLPGQMLVLAHTEELVEQNRKKIQEVNPTLRVTKEMGEDYGDVNADIISGSVQTLGRDNSARAARFAWGNIDKLVIDEAHHSTGDAYQRVFDYVGSLNPATNKLLLGVTATSQRPDGKALSDIYEKVAYVYTLRQAIRDKFLVPIRGYRVTTDTSLADVSQGSGDFAKGALARTVNTPSRNERVVKEWERLGENRQTICFTVDIEHAEAQAAAFRSRGHKAEAVWGDDPEREAKLERHQRGETTVLCNCSVLIEGYDDPSIACIILARPTQSGVLFTQMVGRGTRLHEGKTDLIVIDVVDSTINHSLITLPTLMGMSNILDLSGADLLVSADEIEAAQEQYPQLDLTKLDDISKLKTIIEQVDMFEVRFPKEVEENSELTWFRAVDGGYKMLIPREGDTGKPGFMQIYENPLGQWSINGKIHDVQLAGVRPTMEEAFKASDETIRRKVGKIALACVQRQATWHGKPVSKGQRKMLARLFPHRVFPLETMTQGMASRIIGERLARRAK